MNSEKPQKRKLKAKNEMLRFLGAHLIVGVATATLFLLSFVIFDLSNLRTLVQKNDLALVVYPLLFVFFSITFGSTAMGVGIMNIKKADDLGGGKKIDLDFYPRFATLAPAKRRANNQT